MKLYISFGQIHTHSVNGKTFDKDCIASIQCKDYEEGRKLAFEYFGGQFGTDYSEERVEASLHYFPRGIIPVNH